MARSNRRVRPPGGFELWWWYFMRLSGLLLVVLALGHLFIMHIAHNVEQINYAFVASRWSHPTQGVLWRLWDLSMISLAVMHGFNGIRQVTYEYLHRPFQRVVVTTAIWSAAVVLIVIGSYAILRFEADKDYLRRFEAANPGRIAAAQAIGDPIAPLAAATPTALTTESQPR
jgi:succinate dehydrogenase / fumarate reductase membrane anchor subunit